MKVNRFIRSLGFLFPAMAMSFSAFGAQGDMYEGRRQSMVEGQIKARGINDEKVLEAMLKVERHLFVPDEEKENAYMDSPLPIGGGQTISQPYIVAYMTKVLGLNSGDRVLEIGAGSGYQAAVLAEIVNEVYTIEIIEELARSANERLEALGYDNVFVTWGDGYKGWPEKAPFDAIMVTAAPPSVPDELVNQLKIGGRMVIPVGQFFQELKLITRTESGPVVERLLPVRFVPMVRSSR